MILLFALGSLQHIERFCPASNTNIAALPARTYLSPSLDMLLLGKVEE